MLLVDFGCTIECSKQAMNGLWLRKSKRRIIVCGETKRWNLIANSDINIVKSFSWF